MKSAQRQKSKNEVDQSSSLKFVKNLFRISISTVCWLRNVFPESSFDDLDRGASGTKLKMISRSNENSEASTLLKWMDKGVFDALKSRYLKTMAFCIFEGSGDRDASRLLERYMFKITYPESGGYGFDNVSVHTESNDGASQTSVMSPKALQAKAVHMIRGLISLCSTFEALPEERTISMFLFYHDNVTPRDYEPECFSCVPDGASYISGKEFVDNALSLHLGTLNSRYHCMSMKVKARDENVREEEPCPDGSLNIELSETEQEEEDDEDETQDTHSICLSQKHLQSDFEEEEEDQQQQIPMTIDSEALEDEVFEELPPWRKLRVQVCRAIVAVFSKHGDFAQTKYITVDQIADKIEVSRDVAVKVLEQMHAKKLLGRCVGDRGHRIYRNEHTRMECRVAKSALKGLKIKNHEDDDSTQIDIDELEDNNEAARRKSRSYRLKGLREERNDPPFLQKAPSPRRVLQSQRKRTIPSNTNLKRNRIHGADWLETARNKRGVSNDCDDDESSCDEEKIERELIGEFSQDSIFKELVDHRKSSSSARPIYQYGRKKKRRRGSFLRGDVM